MKRLLTTALLASALPLAALAAGGDSSTPPATTNTTKSCTNGKVWDEKKGACVAPSRSQLPDDTLFEAARELAYDGQYAHASAALDAMEEDGTDRILTYRGFLARKSGDLDAGMAYYAAAIDKNPDNLLVRSYMGQAFVEMGNVEAAREQLTEIRARGGRTSWPEYALRTAIEQGTGYSY